MLVWFLKVLKDFFLKSSNGFKAEKGERIWRK
jgi:hypothetical protein